MLLQRSTEMSPPGVRSQPEDVPSSQDPGSVLGFLTELPNKTIPHNTANNLTQVLERSWKHTQTRVRKTIDSQCPFPYTQVFLRSVEEVLSSPVLPEVNEFMQPLGNPKHDTMQNMQLAWHLRDPWDFSTAPRCAKSTSSSRETVCPSGPDVLSETLLNWACLSASNIKVQCDPSLH